jgi:hypothetical protein
LPGSSGRPLKAALLSLDLPAVAPIARREVKNASLVSRVKVLTGDFFVDALPSADVIVMGNVLHDWNEEGKQKLIAKAYAAFPAGGVLIAIENVIDDARRQHAFGLLMSLNMLIELGADGGFRLHRRAVRRLVPPRRVRAHRDPAADRTDQRGDRVQVRRRGMRAEVEGLSVPRAFFSLHALKESKT